MRRRTVTALVTAAALATTLVGATTASASPPTPDPDARYDVYTGEVTLDQVGDIVALGVDRHELDVAALARRQGTKARARVEVILSNKEAERLRGKGLDLELKEVDGGQSVAQRATALQASGYEVWQTYAGPGGLKEEVEQAAAAHPDIAKLVTIGQSTNGQDIVAVKVTKQARRVPDGTRPAAVYLSAQHAREWITPEMTTRLLAHVLDGYGTDPEITSLVDTRELWFIPVANPDGYDFTFEPGQRLWRKNLRDNNGDGVIAPGDGVDLNRNYPYKWGYDNEGSSPNPSSETYRGPAPGSEPETQALDAFVQRVDPEFFVNYHSAAELILYGIGWQVATPSPDDVIYEAMAGDDADPAVPGYDPDISAELYTTNGDTDTHLQALYGTLGFTPEMSTCEAASDVDPTDAYEAAECGSGFEFPDDEGLVQAEFEKNIPFALSVAASAADPDDPVTVTGESAADFVVDSFDVSYGDPQTVAVTAKRALQDVRLRYRVDGGATTSVRVSEWAGGERYGDENDDYYAELRAQVTGAAVGSDVEVWFTGVKPGTGPVESERFSYTVAADTGHDVLVVANEDYTGVNPDYPPGVTAPKYAAAHVAAVEAAGYSADVWDVDAQGVPHDLAVLGHYDAVLWYLGDNRITQDPEDLLTATPFGNLPNLSVAERQQYLTLAVRDYLNEGGTLVHAGETAQYQGLSGFSTVVGGLYYGLNGAPEEECVISPRPTGSTAGFFDDCLLLADDFRQYWLGAYTRSDTAGPEGVAGVAEPVEGFAAGFGGPVAEGANPLNEAGAYVPTSDVLPVEQFPQFASQGAVEYAASDGSSPFAPVEGERYAGALHADDTWTRLTRTVDVPAGSSTQLQLQLSYNVEPGYDHVVVEARTAGGDDWTTLPDLNGGTSTAVPAECEAGFFVETHPFLLQYLGQDCTPAGTSGTWNSFTGSSGGWTEAAFDLSAYAGSTVEVSVSYVTDPAFGETGAFVDDTRVVVDGQTVSADGFEGATSSWTVGGPPPGSPGNGEDWQLTGQLVQVFGGTSTDSTLLLGFGLEQLATDEARADLVGRALGGLLP